MPDLPFRTRVKMALTDALAEITPAAGYITDLSPTVHDDGQPMRRVTRGRAFFGDGDPLPMVAILERPDPSMEAGDPPQGARVHTSLWELLVQGFARDEGEDPTDEADALLADVKRRLAVERERRAVNGRFPDPLGLGDRHAKNRVEELSFGTGVVRPADEISAKAYFWLGVRLKLIEDPLFPFV